MSRWILALDQGTSSSRAVIYDEAGQVVASASESFETFYPKPGWVEQNPETLFQTQLRTAQMALDQAGIKAGDIAAIGIANQRETVVAWNKSTGEALGNAIVWQCRRTADFCEELKQEGLEETIKDSTGLVIDPYFSGTKIRWILQNNPEAKALLKKGQLLFGTVDSWLVFRLSGGRIHVTDASNASRTQLYNIHEGKWDEDLLARFGIQQSCLPQVVASSGVAGETDPDVFGAAVPIAGIAGDQQAALFGQVCFQKGMAKNTYGTGCFLLMNTGESPVSSKKGLLTTIAWKIGGTTSYALEGSVFTAGSLMQWLRDSMGFYQDTSQSEAMAKNVDSTDDIYFVPAFSGLGSPHWDPYARGMLVGLTHKTQKAHIVRAALESIALQSADLLKAMQSDSGFDLKTLKVDGGASRNGFLCQFQADVLGVTVSRPTKIETTARGAAFLAGLAVGVWRDTDQISQIWTEDRSFDPAISESEKNAKLLRWSEAVNRSKKWAR